MRQQIWHRNTNKRHEHQKHYIEFWQKYICGGQSLRLYIPNEGALVIIRDEARFFYLYLISPFLLFLGHASGLSIVEAGFNENLMDSLLHESIVLLMIFQRVRWETIEIKIILRRFAPEKVYQLFHTNFPLTFNSLG